MYNQQEQQELRNILYGGATGGQRFGRVLNGRIVDLHSGQIVSDPQSVLNQPIQQSTQQPSFYAGNPQPYAVGAQGQQSPYAQQPNIGTQSGYNQQGQPTGNVTYIGTGHGQVAVPFQYAAQAQQQLQQTGKINVASFQKQLNDIRNQALGIQQQLQSGQVTGLDQPSQPAVTPPPTTPVNVDVSKPISSSALSQGTTSADLQGLIQENQQLYDKQKQQIIDFATQTQQAQDVYNKALVEEQQALSEIESQPITADIGALQETKLKKLYAYKFLPAQMQLQHLDSAKQTAADILKIEFEKNKAGLDLAVKLATHDQYSIEKKGVYDDLGNKIGEQLFVFNKHTGESTAMHGSTTSFGGRNGHVTTQPMGTTGGLKFGQVDTAPDGTPFIDISTLSGKEKQYVERNAPSKGIRLLPQKEAQAVSTIGDILRTLDQIQGDFQQLAPQDVFAKIGYKLAEGPAKFLGTDVGAQIQQYQDTVQQTILPTLRALAGFSPRINRAELDIAAKALPQLGGLFGTTDNLKTGLLKLNFSRQLIRNQLDSLLNKPYTPLRVNVIDNKTGQFGNIISSEYDPATYTLR